MPRARVRIGIVGKNNHAARLIRILQKNAAVDLHAVYYPFRSPPSDLPLTKDFSRILECDGVIIASPTPTHGFYLRKLARYQGHVLVEKPATSSLKEIQEFRRWDKRRKSRILVNFNVLHSDLYKNLAAACRDKRLGRLISFDVHTSHGLAFTKAYKNSWRKKHGGVLETVGVHYVNLVMNLFGEVRNVYPRLSWIASKSDAPDTASLSFTTANGVQVNLRHSYAAPALHQWLLVGSNGYWIYDGKQTRLYHPRTTLDSKGRFATPPVKARKNFDQPQQWEESLSRSIADFVNAVKTKRRFDPKDFDRALLSIQPIAEALRTTKSA